MFTCDNPNQEVSHDQFEYSAASPGDELLLLGDEERGLALVKSSAFLASIERFKREMSAADSERGE